MDEWLELMNYVSQAQDMGLATKVLEWADALDQETVVTLIQLRVVRDRLLADRREREAKNNLPTP